MAQQPPASGHPFDQALAFTQRAPGVFDGRPHPAYANMVGPFGGITAAQMLQSVLLHPGLLGEPVALTVNFAAGLRDAPFVIEARAARTNRSTQHWTMALRQNNDDGAEETMITATAVTATRRVTWSATDVPMPAVPCPADVPRQQPPPMFQAHFIQRYEVRFVTGHVPRVWDGAESDSVTQLWTRDDPPRPLDFASLTAQADVFFPRIMRRRAVPTPAGTVSMTVYFHAGASELAASGDYLLGQARAQSFFNGYFDQSAELWNEAGQLLATTHQIVYYKE